MPAWLSPDSPKRNTQVLPDPNASTAGKPQFANALFGHVAVNRFASVNLEEKTMTSSTNGYSPGGVP